MIYTQILVHLLWYWLQLCVCCEQPIQYSYRKKQKAPSESCFLNRYSTFGGYTKTWRIQTCSKYFIPGSCVYVIRSIQIIIGRNKEKKRLFTMVIFGFFFFIEFDLYASIIHHTVLYHAIRTGNVIFRTRPFCVPQEDFFFFRRSSRAC